MIGVQRAERGGAVSLPATFALRFTGGLGDHILAMRVLPFVRDRYPSHEIVVYSDAGGHPAPLIAVSMSPLVSRVVPVFRRAQGRAMTSQELELIRHEHLAAMLSADMFLDMAGSLMCVNASRMLDVSPIDILAHRPQLTVDAAAVHRAAQILAPYGPRAFVGISLASYGDASLGTYRLMLRSVIDGLLAIPGVIILNMFMSSYDFPHLGERRTRRRQMVADDCAVLNELSDISDRIIKCVDMPLETIAALLCHCQYFIGVDNGIKHLAWALEIPLSFFSTPPGNYRILRWMPDYNRLLPFACSQTELTRHFESVRRTITRTQVQLLG